MSNVIFHEKYNDFGKIELLDMELVNNGEGYTLEFEEKEYFVSADMQESQMDKPVSVYDQLWLFENHAFYVPDINGTSVPQKKWPQALRAAFRYVLESSKKKKHS